MKRRIKSLFTIAALMLLSAGCGAGIIPAEESGQPEVPGLISDNNDGPLPSVEQKDTQERRGERAADVRIALVTDDSPVMDNGFNQAALQGIETYANGACISYSCYSTDDDTPDAYEKTVLAAIQDQAKLIICAGSHFEQAVGSLQDDYGDTCFLLLDGSPRDAYGNIAEAAPNVHCITYEEEEAGYLVGYMSVLDGYRQFGFIGGEPVLSVQKYGYGYLQGIDAAAVSLEISDDVRVEYWYADSFSPSKQVEEISTEWYQEGTEVIFACGGALYQSVLASAEKFDGMLIGTDVDQSGISGLFLTSATKGIDSSVIVALDEFFANGRKWPEKLAGKVVPYGAGEKCIGLPVQDDAWRFETATTKEYLQILAGLRTGDIRILFDADIPPDTAVKVIYHNQQEERDS